METTEYTLRGIKTFRGMDGIGLNASLYRNGVKVAFVLDEGCGGMVMYEFTKPEEQAAFQAFAEKWFSESGASADYDKELTNIADGRPTHPDANPDYMVALRREAARDTWVNRLVDEYENEKRLKRLSKVKTLFRVEGETYEEGEWRIYKAPYSERIAEGIRKHFAGKQVQFWTPKTA